MMLQRFSYIAVILTVFQMHDAHADTALLPSVETMSKGLATRLERNPNDIGGWLLLSRSYRFLHRWDDARMAFQKAKDLGYQGEEPIFTDDVAIAEPANKPLWE